MDLQVLADRLCVCRLPTDAPWPAPPADHSFYSVTRTAAEISVVCTEDAAPAGARTETDWRALEVAGPLDFSMVGVMASLTAPLADVDVSVFVVSTYDTDYLLVHAAALERAVAALREAGHQVDAA
ncbi:MAG TPA: ACT domain-containing protein [Candidatus Nanopelagicales bacterium]|nr:ACT domain-containing protein [Candidatus Nanopelagicales bacterium]